MSFSLTQNQRHLRVTNSKPSFQNVSTQNQQLLKPDLIKTPQHHSKPKLQQSPDDITIESLLTQPIPAQNPPLPVPQLPNEDFPTQDLTYQSRFTENASPDTQTLPEPQEGFYGTSIFAPVHELEEKIRAEKFGIFSQNRSEPSSPLKKSLSRSKRASKSSPVIKIPSRPPTPLDFTVTGVPKSPVSIPQPHDISRISAQSIKLQSQNTHSQSSFTVQNFSQIEQKFAEIYQAEYIILLARQERLLRQKICPGMISAVTEQILQQIQANAEVEAEKQVIGVQKPVLDLLQSGIRPLSASLEALPISYLKDKISSICDVIQLKFCGKLTKIRAVPMEKMSEIIDQIQLRYDAIDKLIAVQKSEFDHVSDVDNCFKEVQELQYKLSSLRDRE